jgi:flagellar hook protein FlgE
MVTMMLAQRLFAASARVVQTGDEMLRDAIDALGGG